MMKLIYCTKDARDFYWDLDENKNTSYGQLNLVNSGGASIEGTRVPPLLKFWDEKKEKNTSCQKTLYAKSFK